MNLTPETLPDLIRRLGIVLSLALLPACHEAERRAAVPELPALARPVYPLAPREGAALLRIPEELVTVRGGWSGVFVLRDGRARFQPVKLGRRAAGQVEVLAGLRGGEKLVGGDFAEVRDGSPIKLEARR